MKPPTINYNLIIFHKIQVPLGQDLEVMVSHLVVRHHLAVQIGSRIHPEPIVIAMPRRGKQTAVILSPRIHYMLEFIRDVIRA